MNRGGAFFLQNPFDYQGMSAKCVIAAQCGVVWWPTYARMMRGEVLRIKHELFVDAGRARTQAARPRGASRWLRLRRHTCSRIGRT
jgi:ABC-type dipeptide/oligopeptide/nickel transport system permease subunit